MYAKVLLGGIAVGVAASGCAARGPSVARPGEEPLARVAPAGADTLLLRAVWSPDQAAPNDAVLTYWVTWVRNGEQVGSDTVVGLSQEVRIRRMGAEVPDTVVVTLWTLNHGVLSRRAHWQDRIYRFSDRVLDTIDLGPAPPPELDVPRPPPTPPGDVAAEAPSPPPPPVPAPAAPVVATPVAALAKPGPVRRVVLRIMDPPPSWVAKGWDGDCVAGVRAEGPLTLVALPETPEHCKPYIESYGATSR
jgi:hypothetical protein